MYQGGGAAAAGGTLAATGAAVAHIAWLAVALFTVGFAFMALSKLTPRKQR